MMGIMKKHAFTVLLATCLGMLAIPANADPGKSKGKGKGSSVETPGKGNKGNPGKGDKDKPDKGNKDNPGKGNKGGVSDFEKFDDKDHKELHRYFSPDNRKNLPPGLRKNLERGKPLPPGWQKKVERGQVIDAEWLNLMTPVSYDLLPGVRRTQGTRLYYHENRVIRVDEKTRLILDVISLLSQ